MTNEEDENFLSKVSMDNKEDDNDNVVDSILNKDDDNISKTELDGSIETLIERLQSLDLQESLIPEKAKNKAEQHGEERKLDTKEKLYKKSLRIFAFREKYKDARAIQLPQKRNREPKDVRLNSQYQKESSIP